MQHHVFSYGGTLIPCTLRLEIKHRTRVWLSELYDGFDTAIMIIQSLYRANGWMITDTLYR